MEKGTHEQTATFAAGCFWGVEELFRQTPGVTSTEVGYTGGTVDKPSYEQVCTDATGHAEAVRITFDPTKVSYKDLLKLFFENHNPTTVNRQGPDMGSQYRSAIFVHSEDQRKEAKQMIEELDSEGAFGRPIVTQVVDAAPFFAAEDYHQQYLHKRGLGSCHM